MTIANTDFIPDWDVVGYDYLSVPSITSSFDCQRACDDDAKCRAWTFVSNRQVNNNCFLKTGIPYLEADPTCTSGIKQRVTKQQQLVWIYINRTLSQQNPGASRVPLAGTFWMDSESSNDQWFLHLNIFVDHSVIEVFESQGGRVIITTRVYPEEDTADKLAVYVNTGPTTNQNIIINTLDVWSLNGIWT
jgi:sucrose-6-phosphate hydrolase SacC (GH32 family)